MLIKPDLIDFEPYAQLLESNMRIKLYDRKYFRRVNILIYTFFTIMISTFSSLYIFDIINLIVLTSLGIFVIALFLYVRRISKRLRSASIIGDSLILKNSKRKPYLTTLNTIKKVRSYSILSVQCTQLDYHLDGKRHKTILIGNPPEISITLDKFFINAKHWCKNKNKRQTISRVQ